jgi:hypothetical protein
VLGFFPGLDPHGGVEAGFVGAQRRGPRVAAGDLVGEDGLEERVVGQVVLAGQGEALGQGLFEAGEFQGA